MCILCVVQKWSRRAATMLPWLVIPLIILWALSQLLPRGLRVEITSPRLACVLVLLVTLFWYEILVPQLSVWQARRSARLRERAHIRAIELQKFRKMATRRCRNCHTAYRDQNPGGGGRFMCSYCGHVSKRPVLDIPGPAGSSGIIGDFVGKKGWICNQDWSAESAGNWAGTNRQYWAGDSLCSTERSYSGVFVSSCRLLSWFFFSTRWFRRKFFMAGSLRGAGCLDAEDGGLSSRKGENGGSFQESRGEKARRKAEEKRQARLEKVMLEEEERRQREEVARLVEERRRLRDEKLVAMKECSKGSASGGERGGRKETEKNRQERRKEKDKGSSKSNSDVEELKKSASRESKRKHEFDKRAEHREHDLRKPPAENHKSHGTELGRGYNVRPSKTRCLDRMKGTFLSSSRGFNGSSFLGRNTQSCVASATKASKPPVRYLEYRQNHQDIRNAHSTGHIVGKSSQNGNPGLIESDAQPRTNVLKKSWHQLFTRSSAVSPYPDTNTTSFANQNIQLEAGSAQFIDHNVLPNYSFDNPMNFGRSLPSTYALANGVFNSNSIDRGASESTFIPLVTESGQDSISEDAELFEDPCYIPDPILLLGPVSELLDNFPLDLGAGFVANDKMERSGILKNAYASADVNKLSPIESPMSRLRGSEERRTTSSQIVYSPMSQKIHASDLDDSSNAHEQGTWQMWGSPTAQDGICLIGGLSSWFSTLGKTKSIQEDSVLPLSYNPTFSELAKENHFLPAICFPRSVCVVNHDNGGTYSPYGGCLNGSDLCFQNTPSQPLPIDREIHFLPHSLIDDIARNEVRYESLDPLAAAHPFELLPANRSSRNWVTHSPKDAGNPTSTRPHVGGLFLTNPDVQSVWSFD